MGLAHADAPDLGEVFREGPAEPARTAHPLLETRPSRTRPLREKRCSGRKKKVDEDGTKILVAMPRKANSTKKCDSPSHCFRLRVRRKE